MYALAQRSRRDAHFFVDAVVDEVGAQEVGLGKFPRHDRTATALRCVVRERAVIAHAFADRHHIQHSEQTDSESCTVCAVKVEAHCAAEPLGAVHVEIAQRVDRLADAGRRIGCIAVLPLRAAVCAEHGEGAQRM